MPIWRSSISIMQQALFWLVLYAAVAYGLLIGYCMITEHRRKRLWQRFLSEARSAEMLRQRDMKTSRKEVNKHDDQSIEMGRIDRGPKTQPGHREAD